MKFRGLLLVALVVACALSLRATTGAGAQSGGIQLAFAPASSSFAVGGAVNVDVTVANVPATPGLGGYDVTITFNRGVVRLDALTDAKLFTQNIAICTPAQIDNTAGTGTIACTPLLGLAPGFSTTAPVPMLHATFTAIANGTSPLSLSGSTLSDPSSNPLAATLGAGTITVNAAAQPTATARASTTAAPMATATATPLATSTVAAAPSVAPSPQPSPGVATSVVQPPATGTGGSSGGSPWPWIAGGAGVIALAALASAAFLLARDRAAGPGDD